MMDMPPADAILTLDRATRALVRLSARVAGGSELDVRAGLDEVADVSTPEVWVEELILQSYLFAGFPRALNAMRELRSRGKAGGQGQGLGDRHGEADSLSDFVSQGEATCARVYGHHYSKLRVNIRALHPDLDAWMIAEGYGKVLSRPALDLGRRELCIVAACVAGGQDRQLHSHLLGCRNVGVPDDTVGSALEALEGTVPEEHLVRAKLLWRRVVGSASTPRAD